MRHQAKRHQAKRYPALFLHAAVCLACTCLASAWLPAMAAAAEPAVSAATGAVAQAVTPAVTPAGTEAVASAGTEAVTPAGTPAFAEPASLAALPAEIRAHLGTDLADRGGPFAAGCVSTYDEPHRRFVRARIDGDLAQVTIERGGRAHFFEQLDYRRLDGHWVNVLSTMRPVPHRPWPPSPAG